MSGKIRGGDKERALSLSLLLLFAAGIASADTVTVQGPDGQADARLTGEVVDYTGAQLTLRHPSGRTETIDAARVVSVQSDWTAPHAQAMEHFEQREYTEALEQFRAALRAEQRRWVQRRIMASTIWCLQYLGHTEQAIDAFLLLYREDPTTQYFAAIPLAWKVGRPSAALQSRCGKLLDERDSAAGQLIAASWLLATADRSRALAVLPRLLSGSDARIVFLAEAQLWRAQTTTVRPDELDRWQARLEAMPRAIRAGPYFTLATALAARGRHEQAALAWLRIPILYPAHRELAAQALLAAAGELETIGRPVEAQGLYREVIVDYPEAEASEQARQRYETLQP